MGKDTLADILPKSLPLDIAEKNFLCIMVVFFLVELCGREKKLE
jgi:hypothetical protein